MGKRGGKRGGGRGRGGFGGGRGGRPPRDNRVNKADVDRHNEKYEKYYNELGLVPNDDRENLWEAMRRDLPNSFRFTGSKGHALAVQQRLREFYIPKITSIKYEGVYVDTPLPVQWYPDQLAWFMTTPKNVIRRFPPFASFQKFLVAETDVGNITRQEVVSMIPPLLMDIQPGMTVLDLCAAPGSKSAQLIEMIHSGEEERALEVASQLAKGLNRPEGIEYEDDGRSTGLLIANDVDYKRAHMLVHQMKRLSSPNIIVTNHDATIYPSIKLPSERGEPNKYLKFDRILADVPCSGDGTTRKNLEIWRNWNPANGLGLHITQVRILIRALQMLKVGGRVVYSTCSMNPVEDEAVLAAAIAQCGGQDFVQLLQTKDYLPGLQRYPGFKQWKIMDKSGRMWNNYEDVLDHKKIHGEDGMNRLQESMFPPKEELPLDRAVRVYPHQQDTGAFFIAILEKKSEIRAKSIEKPATVAVQKVESEVVNSNGTSTKVETELNGRIADEEAQKSATSGAFVEYRNGSPKRKREDDDTQSKDPKKLKSEQQVANFLDSFGTDRQIDSKETDDKTVSETAPNADTESAIVETEEAPAPAQQAEPPRNDDYKKRKNRDQPFEEPFKYLDVEIPELQQIREFYNISPRFPRDRFMVRNAQSTASKNVYYTTALAKDILQENEGKGMKFVHSGIKMFVKQDVPKPEICPWRIQTDGLSILEAWVGTERIIRLSKRDTLRRLLKEMFPRFDENNWEDLGEIGTQVRDIGMGCCVLIVEPSDAADGLNERMVFPLWKSMASLNLMLPKEDRKAMLLRLFNDDEPLVNLTPKQQSQAKTSEEKDAKKEDIAVKDARRNSSSPEQDDEVKVGGGEASDDEDAGGVELGEAES